MGKFDQFGNCVFSSAISRKNMDVKDHKYDGRLSNFTDTYKSKGTVPFCFTQHIFLMFDESDVYIAARMFKVRNFM